MGAYISIAYIVALPAASFIALWRQQKLILTAGDAKRITQHPGGSMEMITGMCFLQILKTINLAHGIGNGLRCLEM